MINIAEYEKQQLEQFQKSSIFKELNKLTVEKGYKCTLRIGNMHPEVLKAFKIQKARVLSVGLYLNDHIVTDDEGAEYDFSTDLVYILKNDDIKFFRWEKDEEFIANLRDTILWLKKNNKSM